jgi:hypothetical protein
MVLPLAPLRKEAASAERRRIMNRTLRVGRATVLARSFSILLAGLMSAGAMANSPADLKSQGGLKLGTKSVPWGGSLTLTDAGALLLSNGNCAFNIEYVMVNAGPGATQPAFANRLRSGAVLVSVQTNLTLAAGETRTIWTQGYLAPGVHTLTLTLDDGGNVAESDETNNTYSAQVEVKGPCGKPASNLADITAKGSITIGGQTAAWGGTIALDDTKALLISNGKCAFRVSYDMVNQGQAGTSTPFSNRIRASAQVVTQQGNLVLAAGQAKNILTDPYLPAGTYSVELSLDDGGQVPELNEGNNKLKVNVTVGGKCM